MLAIINIDEDDKDDNDLHLGDLGMALRGTLPLGPPYPERQLTACRVDLHQHLPLGPAILLGQCCHHLSH